MANQEDDDDKKPKSGDDEVDTSQEEDENDTTDEEDESGDDTEDQEEDDSSEDEDDSGESDEDESDDEEESDFKKQFPSIKGDTPEEYISNLEETYRKSSREGKRLAKTVQDLQGRVDAITQAVAKNPELAKLINEAVPEGGTSPVQDPALLHAREQMESQMEKEYNEFVDEHPELDSDPELQEKVLKELEILGAAYRAKGKTLGMKRGLALAYESLGLDDGGSKERIAGAAKTTAARTKTTGKGGKKPKAKGSLTPEQVAYGKRMGLTEKQMLEFANK